MARRSFLTCPRDQYRVWLPPGKKSARCPRCNKRVTTARPAKSLWRATTLDERVRNRERAERELEDRLTALKRLTTSISMWQRRVKYYTREVEKTDEQRADERLEQEQRRETRRTRVRRIRV